MAKTSEPGQPTPPESTAAKTGGSASAQPKPDEMRAASVTPAEAGPAASSSTAPGTSSSTAGRAISERKGQFLIAPRRTQALMAMGIAPLQFSVIEQTLRASPDIEVVDTVGPKNIVGVLADGMGEAPSVLVARMTEQKAAILHQQAQGRLIVERDQSLALLDTGFPEPALVASSNLTTGPVLSAAFLVIGKDNAPLKDAEVYLFGSMLPASGVTNERGQVTLTLYGETPQSIRSLYVKPKYDYWSFYQQQPDISVDEANVVGLKPLSDWPSLANFPQQQIVGWGQKAMRLDQLPGNYRGQGVKIAIIDSGAATTHEDLKKIRFGFDVINKKTNPNTWNEDSVSHGSHCAGIIAGADNAFGVRGFAPDAEIHACKLFPGGQISQLIDALEYCIEKQIDVVNLSLGGAEPSEALEQQIQRAKRAGVACIVAAGNSGGRVQYPGASPNVLAVAAIGRVNEFPPDSYHSQTMTQLMDMNGFFSAKFTCYGPEVGVCGPGVAITSSVPPNNFAVWDGTSMATPHITGLAGLVLAHHPDFQGAYKMRGPERVERLFQVIRASARPVNVGDPGRTGFGLPDVLVAVGLQTQAGMQVGAATTAPQQANVGALGGLLPQQAGIAPFGAAYYDPAQLLQQQGWMGSPWMQGGQQLGGINLAGLDPMVAAYYRQQLFGMPSGFVRQAW